MTQYQVQDMARQAAQTAPTSAFQPVAKSEPPPLPRNMAVPVVVVEKLPISMLPKREVQLHPLQQVLVRARRYAVKEEKEEKTSEL